MKMIEPINKHDLNDDNYYSKEAGKKYLSVHALMNYMSDPSLFWLKGNGYLPNTSSDAANAGKIFHAFVNDEKDYTKEMTLLGKTPFNVGKGKNAPTEEEIVYLALNDPFELVPKAVYESVWQYVLNNWDRRHEIWNDDDCYKELILTGKIGGAPFKGRLDVLRVDGDKAYIYDYKTLGLKERYGKWYDGEQWHDKTFVEEYNYDLQMTAYARLVMQNFPEVKDVFVTFGVLVKGGKHDFAEYPSAFIETETVNVKDMSKPRFKNGQTPGEILMHEPKYAYQAVNMDENEFRETYGTSLMMELTLDSTGAKLPFYDFRLK